MDPQHGPATTPPGLGSSRRTPTPTGDSLELSVRCWTARSGPQYAHHMITLRGDWSVATPHDLEAERVAVALGGYSSCAELPRRSVPAARHWLDLECRVAPVPIRFAASRRWHATTRLRCCPLAGFDTAARAADHARSTDHLAVQFCAPLPHIEDLTTAIRRAYRGTAHLQIDHVVAEVAAAALTHGRRDVTALWYAGISPQTIVDICAGLGVTGKLPAQYFLGAQWRGRT